MVKTAILIAQHWRRACETIQFIHWQSTSNKQTTYSCVSCFNYLRIGLKSQNSKIKAFLSALMYLIRLVHYSICVVHQWVHLSWFIGSVIPKSEYISDVLHCFLDRSIQQILNFILKLIHCHQRVCGSFLWRLTLVSLYLCRSLILTSSVSRI